MRLVYNHHNPMRRRGPSTIISSRRCVPSYPIPISFPSSIIPPYVTLPRCIAVLLLHRTQDPQMLTLSFTLRFLTQMANSAAGGVGFGAGKSHYRLSFLTFLLNNNVVLCVLVANPHLSGAALAGGLVRAIF